MVNIRDSTHLVDLFPGPHIRAVYTFVTTAEQVGSTK
jgi:hypothetical protein